MGFRKRPVILTALLLGGCASVESIDRSSNTVTIEAAVLFAGGMVPNEEVTEKARQACATFNSSGSTPAFVTSSRVPGKETARYVFWCGDN